METTPHKLDNPVVHSLHEVHSNKAISYRGVIFYAPVYCAFGGSVNPFLMAEGLSAYAQNVSDFFVVGDSPRFEQDLQIEKELICAQMILAQPIPLKLTETILPLQSTLQKQALFELVNLVQPGYFKEKTVDMGRYFGIYRTGQLVAVAGERMKMNNYTEISAIVTHPDYTRKGFAQQLIKHLTDLVFEEGKIPYLHVVATNQTAIQLYKKLGFTHRREISFWKLKHR